MKKLTTLAVAAGAIAGAFSLSASPAAAHGYCGYGYGYGYYGYYGYRACCPRYYSYAPAYYYRPVVRKVTYYRVYAPVVRRHWRSCCR
jgi:hypothetical protein